MIPRWFRIALATGARRVVAAPAGALVGLVFYVLVVGAVTSLWRVAAAANGGAVAGYDAVALTWYLAVSEAAYLAVNSRLIQDIGDDIVDGQVTSEMLRPAPVVAVRLGLQMGRAVPWLAAYLCVGAVMCLVMAGPPPSVGALALSMPALLLAAACNVVAIHGVAAVTFWLRDARTGWFLYQKLVFLFGGMLLPLEVLPGPMHAVAAALPFMAMAYAPARLAAGHVEPVLLVVQAAWLVVLTVVTSAAFRAGERRLQAVGG